MKTKTSELTGYSLNYAVAVCLTLAASNGDQKLVDLIDRRQVPDYSTEWAHGGPVITDAWISRTIDHSGLWIAYVAEGYGEPEEDKKFMHCDRSELVAALRCLVAKHFGDTVEVPDELEGM